MFSSIFGVYFLQYFFIFKLPKETLCNIDNVTVFKVNSLLSFIIYMKSYCPNAVKVL